MISASRREKRPSLAINALKTVSCSAPASSTLIVVINASDSSTQILSIRLLTVRAFETIKIVQAWATNWAHTTITIICRLSGCAEKR